MIDYLRQAKHGLEIQLQRFRLRRIYNAPHANVDLDQHIAAAAAWLCRAQDAGTDQGVAYGSAMDGDFLPSYPETTGYIIPTFLQLARVLGDDNFRQRAVAMGKWEAQIQLQSGAVMAGMLNSDPKPAVFNTGQVLLGWADLWQETGDDEFVAAARRAASWLVTVQESDGRWLTGNSPHADAQSTVYNVRAAWGLLRVAQLAEEDSWRQAALRNADYAMSQQQANGWFANCCLDDAQRPLLHTLAYTARGLLEIGALEQRQDYIQAAQRTADALCQLLDENGYLPGRFHPNFQTAVSYCCLTGSAQTAIIFLRLMELTGKSRYGEAARRLNDYLMRHHDLHSASPSVRGGMAGSWPIHGAYGRFKVLNWATKFLLDSLLLQQRLDLTA